MGSNNGDSTIVSRNDPIECSGTTVEIKIKTLDSQTYTLRVDKCVSVPALKEQVAIVTGVLSEQQRLICRGKVLKDDQLLSAYHVEDGHTLHLVVRQPSPQPTNLPDGLATDRMPSADNGRGGVVVGSFNISEQGEGAFPDLSRIVSAVLGSFGLSNIGSDRGVDLREPTSDRDQGTPYGFRDFSGHQSDQAATVGQPNPLNGSPSAPFTIAFPLESQHPPVIPDSLSTLSLYLTHLRNEFALIARGADGSSRTAGAHRNNVPASSAASSATARHGGLPTPASLADVLLSARQLLIEQAAECLLQLREQLANHENIADTSARTSIQSSAIRLGSLLQNLGALLLELGRTTTTLRMGATPAEAVVNAGPAVFISTAGPNPIMVQPLSFQSGSNFGAIPMANLQPNSVLPGVSPGSAFLPRNIDIRIRRGSLMSTSVVSQREPSLAMQSSGQPVPEAASAGGISVTESAPRASTPSSREPEVRIVPIRTVVAAVPANITQTPSDSSNSPMGLFYPILARVQHVASANRDEAGSSQVSNEHLPSGTDGERSPTFGSVGQPLYGANHLASESQTNLGFASGTHGRFDQLLRTIFPGEQSQFGSNANIQGETTGYNALQAVTTGATVATQNVESTVSDEGTFLSNLLHQIMPFIAQNVEMCPTTTENQDRSPRNNLQTSFSQDEQNLDAGTSHSQAGPSTPPCAKRQKRE